MARKPRGGAAVLDPPAGAAADVVYPDPDESLEKPQPVQDEVRILPLKDIRPSPFNPRKTFKGMEELTESIRVKGVVQPIIVRPVPMNGAGIPLGKGAPSYELVCGERRWRASKDAGQTTIPAICRDYTDKHVLEIQVIENDQRQDPDPLEQAFGYKQMIDAGYDVPTLAGKIGRDESYVYKRLQLTKLIPALQKAMQQDKLPFRNAMIFARLTERDQKTVATTSWLFDSDTARVNEHVRRHFMLDLAGAAFPKDVPLGGAGACTECSKRTGFNPALFNDIAKKDTCTDGKCFHAKQQAFVQLRVKALEAQKQPFVRVAKGYVSNRPAGVEQIDDYGSPYRTVTPREAKKADPKDLRQALVVAGDGVGRLVTVQKVKAGSVSAADDQYRRQEKARKARLAVHREFLGVLLDHVLEKIEDEPDEKAIRRIAWILYKSVYHDAQKALFKRHGWEKPADVKSDDFDWKDRFVARELDSMTLVDVHRFIVECDLVPDLVVFNEKEIPEDLQESLDIHKIDAEAVRRTMICDDPDPTPKKQKKGKARGK